MRSLSSRLIFALLCLVGTAAPLASARAAGAYLADIEAVGMGQGGAFVAAPSTLSAFWYNPASLAAHAGLRVQLETGLHFVPVTFQRDPNPVTGEEYSLVRNQNLLKQAIFAGVTYDFGIPNLAIGVALYSPVSGGYRYNQNGPQRYSAIEANSTAFNVHLGVAYRIFKWLSLGVTFGNTYFQTVQRVAVSGAIGGDAEDPAFSIPFTVDVRDPFTITSNFGIRLDPIEQLSIGLSVTPPYDVVASGTATVSLPPALSGVIVDGDQVNLSVRFPLIFRAGLRYRPLSILETELAFVYEGWSRNATIDLAPQDVRVSFPPLLPSTPLPTFQLEPRNRDAYSVRLGFELKPLPLITARAGGWIETSATRPTRFDLTGPDALKGGVSVGASINIWKINIDIAYAHIFAQTTVITASDTRAIAVLPTGPQSEPVGNGRYSYTADLIHLGLRGTFFDSPKPAATPEPSNTPLIDPVDTSSDASAPTTSPSP